MSETSRGQQRTAASLVLLSLLSAPAWAQTLSHADTLHPDALVEAVLANHPLLHAARSAAEAAQWRIAPAGALDDPMLSTMAAPMSFGNSTMGYGVGIELSQRLPWPGKRDLREKIAELEARAALQSIPETRLDLTQLAREAFADWYLIIVAYLRHNPDAAQAQDVKSTLATSRDLLKQAMTAYRGGQPDRAKELALSAYLDGFEPVEPLLAARDNALMVRIEAAMARVRAGIASNVEADELQAQIDTLDGLFAEAEQVLAQNRTSSVASFVVAFTILLREGLEALLIVIAMIALLRKAERTEMLPWVRYSRRLPIGQFFRYSSILIAFLAVILIDKAVSALQEAGYPSINWVDGGPRVKLLGLYPTAQGIAAQVGIALVLAIGFLLANRSTAHAEVRRG